MQYAKQQGHMTSYFELAMVLHLIAELLGEKQQYKISTEDKLTSPHQLFTL
jgi:hypothetical protein